MADHDESQEDVPPLRMVGDAHAGMACAGDVCELPAPAPASIDIE